ncbi:myosin [Carpediemonas membranifera]|uniref:Myosin n=1 Tax=Carpediemonas membranifera TaxID=201153 RepID=A0A8J6BXB2_9EUKA|nr:myosin [Carpediemonas membranifera]|eukprot:KAG9393291.1 myosin [Carpediemonas membranifera]
MDSPKKEGQKKRSTAQDLRHRLETNNLYSLEDLRYILQKVVSSIAADSKSDFEHLLFLDDYIRKVDPEIQTAIPIEITSEEDYIANIEKAIPDIPEFLPETALGRHKVLIAEIHKSILRLINLAMIQRQDRLKLIKTMLATLEANGHFVQNAPTPLDV